MSAYRNLLILAAAGITAVAVQVAINSHAVRALDRERARMWELKNRADVNAPNYPALWPKQRPLSAEERLELERLESRAVERGEAK